jgi:hypothetical protein
MIMAEAKAKQVETKSIEIIDYLDERARATLDFAKDQCNAFKTDLKDNRQTGSDKVHTFIKDTLKIDLKDGGLVKDTAGFMGEMMSVGYTFTVCPARIMQVTSKRLSIAK